MWNNFGAQTAAPAGFPGIASQPAQQGGFPGFSSQPAMGHSMGGMGGMGGMDASMSTEKVSSIRLSYLSILFVCETVAFGILMTLNSTQAIFVSNVRGSAVNPPNRTYSTHFFSRCLLSASCSSILMSTFVVGLRSAERVCVLFRILGAGGAGRRLQQLLQGGGQRHA